MKDFVEVLKKKKITLPDDVYILLKSCKEFTLFDTIEQLAITSVDGEITSTFKVKYDITRQGEFTEVRIHRVTNSISANYTGVFYAST